MKKQINWKQEIVAYVFLILGSALFSIGDVIFSLRAAPTVFQTS